ncbi:MULTISPECIES: HEAT repeat domain-containing protein [Pseudofrankia]|uniref:HEAT repeat domain-containing protein n=1 Tax=Pseudofrankia TaxID=2994363 RepID=UPI000234CB83|nr:MULTISPECIES: HEAT repeat domain-containing protein [Pseudofrankia]OHV37006.1 hypothetical protein BCD49_17325 [Pseudofrankia sp. EUN1h]
MTDELGRLASELREQTDNTQRRVAAKRLRELAFARRRSLEKRGSLDHPANGEMTLGDLDSLRSAIYATDRSVRLDAIVAAGDLGDETFVADLAAQCESADQEIRLAAIDSLGDIGGPESVSVLIPLATNPEEGADIRLAAMTEFEELAAKNITSGPDRRIGTNLQGTTEAWPVFSRLVRSKLVGAMRATEADPSADEFLRLKAADILMYLRERVV